MVLCILASVVILWPVFVHCDICITAHNIVIFMFDTIENHMSPVPIGYSCTRRPESQRAVREFAGETLGTLITMYK